MSSRFRNHVSTIGFIERPTMRTAINRAQFLRGDFSGRSRPIRPPWSLPEEIFVERCTRCGDCIRTCPQHILNAGCGGFPQVDFSRGECLFCGDCARVCVARALSGRQETRAGSAPWSVRARIGESCLALRGVECRCCADPCEAAAIRFRPVASGVAQPALDAATCNGCGACFGVCPSGAIVLAGGDAAPEVLPT